MAESDEASREGVTDAVNHLLDEAGVEIPTLRGKAGIPAKWYAGLLEVDSTMLNAAQIEEGERLVRERQFGTLAVSVPVIVTEAEYVDEGCAWRACWAHRRRGGAGDGRGRHRRRAATGAVSRATAGSPPPRAPVTASSPARPVDARRSAGYRRSHGFSVQMVS